jgi:hypothetical protein
MSTTPKRTQPARRKSTGEVFSTPATPTRGGFVSPSRTASTSKKRKRGAGIASPNPPGRSPRSKHLLFDPSTGQYRVATPQVERELRRSQREKIREIFLTAEFYKSQSRRTPLKRRKVDDGRFVDAGARSIWRPQGKFCSPSESGLVSICSLCRHSATFLFCPYLALSISHLLKSFWFRFIHFEGRTGIFR